MPKKQPRSNEDVLLTMRELGFPDEFCLGVVYALDTDFLSDRMLRYLRNARPHSQEAVADQVIAIIEERDKYRQKHIDDYHSRRKPMDRLFIDSVSINWNEEGVKETYLSNIPAIRNADELVFHKNVTFFVGENGSGKSTLLEALAVANGLNPEGGTQNFRFSTYDDYSELKSAIRFRRKGAKPKWSYFLRAESFYNVATAAMTMYNDDGLMPDYHSRSHGESFLDFIQRYDSQGLYLMDEPEAALSPQRQLTLLLHLYRMAKEGSQFIIATHSPILLGVPDAEIYSFDNGIIHPVSYEETESYQVTKMFINDRERFLHQLLANE